MLESRAKYPHIARHRRNAVRRHRLPRVMHLDRRHADQHRDQALEHVTTKKGYDRDVDHVTTKKGYDRDEYPMAYSREGGRRTTVRYVPLAENRGEGASVGDALRPYCNGQAFKVVFR